MLNDRISKHKYVVELDFTDLDVVAYIDTIDALKDELFKRMSVVLSEMVCKYPALVGFRQDYETSKIWRGEVNE